MALLKREDFQILHEALIKHFRKECEQQSLPFPDTKKQLYGFYEYLNDENGPSLRKSISNHPNVRAKFGRLVIETKNNLYKNKVAVLDKKTSSVAEVRDIQRDAYLLYLDVSSVEELKAIHAAQNPPTEYEGHYFSYVHNKVFTCDLTINYHVNPFIVTMEKFHRQSVSSIYIGEAQKKSNYLFVNLTVKRDEWEDEFKMVAHVPFTNLEDMECLRCLFLGVSSYNYPSAGEMVLLNKKLKKETDSLIIKRYLILKHNRIRIKVEEGGDVLSNLKVKRNFISEIQHMVGTYKVLNIDSNGQLVISKFLINEDYSSSFETDIFSPNENKQICLLEISNVLNKRLCMTTHPDNGAGIISYVMINIPQANEIINEGVFCSVGGSRTQVPPNGNIILLKVKDENFKPESIPNPKEALEKQNDPDLLKAFIRLVEIQRRRKPLL